VPIVVDAIKLHPIWTRTNIIQKLLERFEPKLNAALVIARFLRSVCPATTFGVAKDSVFVRVFDRQPSRNRCAAISGAIFPFAYSDARRLAAKLSATLQAI
jgi:hypothetical protein